VGSVSFSGKKIFSPFLSEKESLDPEYPYLSHHFLGSQTILLFFDILGVNQRFIKFRITFSILNSSNQLILKLFISMKLNRHPIWTSDAVHDLILIRLRTEDRNRKSLLSLYKTQSNDFHSKINYKLVEYI